MLALRLHYPEVRFIGIAGPQMLALGATSLAPMERLSVMGLVEVLGRLRELLRLRAHLVTTLLHEPIDLFIGIDAPDFNLGLAARFRAAGLPTVHYVSPSVWAWRQGRVKGIARSIDLMLCLLPFEKAFYDQHQVRAEFVGHPLADQLPMHTDTQGARRRLGLDVDQCVLAVLPGSRRGEVLQLAPALKESISRFLGQHPDWQVVIPAINAERYAQIQQLFAPLPEFTSGQIKLLSPALGPSVGREAMAAADQVWLASGTATLEAMLLKKPMLVLYRFHWLTYLLARFLVKIRWFSLPNLLLGRKIVPELIQNDITSAHVLAASAMIMQQREELQRLFAAEHGQLRQEASRRAAAAILSLWSERND